MLARSLFDSDVLVAEGDPSTVALELHEAEAAQIANAVEKRRREYGAARTLARRLFGSVGVAMGPLLNGEDRAPVFPSGYVGTISHTAGYCGVAIAGEGGYLGLGLDVEQRAPLKPELLRMILAGEELAAYDPTSLASLARAKLVFSAKESAYKAQYALTRTFLGFSAMRVDVDESAGTFRATFLVPSSTVFAPGDVLEGRFRVDADLVATAVAIPADGPYASRR